MIAQVPQKMRTQANSIANCSYSLLGLFPAPSLYGFVYTTCGAGENRWGLVAIQLFGLASIIFLMPQIICKRHRDNKSIDQYITNQSVVQIEEQVTSTEEFDSAIDIKKLLKRSYSVKLPRLKTL